MRTFIANLQALIVLFTFVMSNAYAEDNLIPHVAVGKNEIIYADIMSSMMGADDDTIEYVVPKNNKNKMLAVAFRLKEGNSEISNEDIDWKISGKGVKDNGHIGVGYVDALPQNPEVDAAKKDLEKLFAENGIDLNIDEMVNPFHIFGTFAGTLSPKGEEEMLFVLYYVVPEQLKSLTVSSPSGKSHKLNIEENWIAHTRNKMHHSGISMGSFVTGQLHLDNWCFKSQCRPDEK